MPLKWGLQLPVCQKFGKKGTLKWRRNRALAMWFTLWPTLDPLHVQISVVNQMSAAINGTAVMDNRAKVTDARATSVTNSLSHQSSHPCFNTRRRGHADFQKDKATMNRKRISSLQSFLLELFLFLHSKGLFRR